MMDNSKAMRTKYDIVEFDSSILVTTYLEDDFLSHLSREVEFLAFLPTPDAIENYFLWHLDLIDETGSSIELMHSEVVPEGDQWKCSFYYRKDGAELKSISNTTLTTCDKCNHINEHHVIAQDRKEFVIRTCKKETMAGLAANRSERHLAIWSTIAGFLSISLFFLTNRLKHLFSLKVS